MVGLDSTLADANQMYMVHQGRQRQSPQARRWARWAPTRGLAAKVVGVSHGSPCLSLVQEKQAVKEKATVRARGCAERAQA